MLDAGYWQQQLSRSTGIQKPASDIQYINDYYYMLTHQTTYRVIYGDTDNMGFAYHANYFRWFEIGRAELFRHVGLSYKEIESKGIFLPVSEAYCKFLMPVQYDDILIIEATLDTSVRAGIKFDYHILDQDGTKIFAKGSTKHACVNKAGKVVRPPEFLTEIIFRNQ